LRIADTALHYALHLIGLLVERRGCRRRLPAAEEPLRTFRLQSTLPNAALTAGMQTFPRWHHGHIAGDYARLAQLGWLHIHAAHWNRAAAKITRRQT
jgi:hypothetical protein